MIFTYVDGVELQYTEIKNSGQYHGRFDRLGYGGSLDIQYSNDVIISHTSFSGFDPRGLIHISVSTSILFEDNVINVDISDLYYNVSDQYIHFEENYAPLVYGYSTDTNTINNEFRYDPH